MTCLFGLKNVFTARIGRFPTAPYSARTKFGQNHARFSDFSYSQ